MCSAGPSAALGRVTRARPFRSEPPSPGGRATGPATGRASTRARGFAAYPRRSPFAESGTGSLSDSAPAPAARPTQLEETAEPQDGRVAADAAEAAAEAVAALPPPTRPNCRCDASSGANAGPKCRPVAARARRRGGDAGLLPTPPRDSIADPLLLAPARAATRQDPPPSAQAAAAGGSEGGREADTHSGVGCSGS